MGSDVDIGNALLSDLERTYRENAARLLGLDPSRLREDVGPTGIMVNEGLVEEPSWRIDARIGGREGSGDGVWIRVDASTTRNLDDGMDARIASMLNALLA